MPKQSRGQVHRNSVGASAAYRGVVDITDIGMIRFATDPRHLCANVDVAGARRSEKACISANCGVIADEVVRERGVAHCRVGIPKIII